MSVTLEFPAKQLYQENTWSCSKVQAFSLGGMTVCIGPEVGFFPLLFILHALSPFPFLSKVNSPKNSPEKKETSRYTDSLYKDKYEREYVQ